MTGATIDMQTPPMSVAGSAISAPMVAALEAAWSAIRAHHPELPPVVIVLGAGSGERGQLRLGHFAAMRWSPTDPGPDGESVMGLAEVFVGGEGLARGPVDVLGTLLHEAAHALAHVRGIQDTSRQGRWHNARFKAVADEVGITVEKDPKLGWSPRRPVSTTPRRSARSVQRCGCAAPARPAARGSRRSPARRRVCACGRRIRVAVSVREAGPIVCGICDAEFRPEEPADDPDGSAEDREADG